MIPEYLMSVPEDLHENYYVTTRPVGKRCLVYTNNNTTFSRDMNGKLIH